MKRLLNSIEDRLTVRQQIAFGTAILCLMLVAGLAGGAAYIGREQATRFVGGEMRGLAASVAGRLDAGISARLREIEFMTTAEPMLARWRNSDPAQVRRLVDEIQEVHPDFVWIGFVRPDGVVKAATNGQLQGVSVVDKPWFKQALKDPLVEEMHEERLADGGLEQTPVATPGLIKIAYPVRDKNGLLIGVVALNLSEDWANDVRQSALQPLVEADQSTIWVLGKDGGLISGGEKGSRPYSEAQLAEMLAEKQGSFTDDLLPGPSLAGFAVAQGSGDDASLGWIVVARRSIAVASLAWRTLVNSILALGGVLAVTGVLMATYLAGRVARPIRGLTAEADLIGRDVAATMVGRHTGSREVVELSSSLRSLVRRLGTAEQRSLQIEQHAAETTRKLNEDVDLLRILAEADPMTGLLNRRAFANASAAAFTDFEARRITLAVLVLDVDHFKRVNDGYGHAAGDAVLRATASLLTSLVRSSDLVSRYGGEEFVVLLRDIQPDNVRLIAETIRGAVAAMRVLHDGREIKVTISIGAAIARPTDRDFEDLFQRADLALYTAKRNGRNQVQEAPHQDLLIAAE